MRMFVVSIRDRAADAYMNPAFVNNLGSAIRSFQDEVNRSAQDNPLYNHPGDFDLYHLGYFDATTGRFENLELPKQVAVGQQLKA